ncbi:MAG: hypothetical protein EA378_08225 [Phycisphaerales bacterium]|nr:MAG: hypothetical protein EA378_08225 [Phycisphaerales bacterium]
MEPTTEPEPRMTREQLVHRILEINPSATREYLDRFREPNLAHYLERLVNAQQPRGPQSAWQRRAETPAIVGEAAPE